MAAPEVETFEAHRSLLFGIAYRMLGSVGEAEDAVQETWIRWRRAGSPAASARAFLATTVTRLCLDQLKSARRQREQYIGPWLPEPLPTGPDTAPGPEGVVEARESISFAFLVLLESLTPVERAVLLLHDVFDFSHGEIASMIGIAEPASRQHLRRSRLHLRERRSRFQSTREEQRSLTERFLTATTTGDVGALVSLLAEDVTIWSDGGGKRVAALKPVHGSDRAVRFLLGVQRKSHGLAPAVVEVNGDSAVVRRSADGVDSLTLVTGGGGRIHEIRIIRNPDKLGRLGG